MEIKTKYTPGQKLYCIYNNKVQEFTVELVEACCSLNYDTMLPHKNVSCKYKLRVGESAGSRLEKYEFEIDSEFFPSKEDLIKSL